MERKSVRKLLILAIASLFLTTIMASSGWAQWWLSSSSTSSSTTSSTSTTSSSTSTSSSSTSSTSSSGSVAACSTNILRTGIPTNPALDGPWPVGSKPVTISSLSSYIWYPATPGSQVGKTKDSYCMKDYLTISGTREEHTWYMNSYRDLPLDGNYGKYPVIIYVHGTGSLKYAHHVLATHWASRGFVVISCDNPYMNIKDVLANSANILRNDQANDTKKIISAVKSPTGDLAFLSGKIDATRIGLSGHSAGGAAVASINNVSGVQVIIPMASAARVTTGLYRYVKAAMLMGGINDNTNTWSNEQNAYTNTTISNKRLVGIPNAGHNVFTNICDSVAKAEQYGFDLGAMETVAHDGCGSSYIDQQRGWEITNYGSTAVFEETLQCNTTSADSISKIDDIYGVTYKTTTK